jgi:hypothetical protein
VLRHGVGVVDVDRAIEEPPDIGRAALRAAYIGELAGAPKRYLCDWHAIWDTAERRVLDFSDPFATTAEWRPWSAGVGDLRALQLRVLAGFAGD